MAVTSHGTVDGFRPSFPLIETKLLPGIEPAGSVERRRLLAALTADPPPQIISVIAPPGYGKTTLLAQWVAREKRPVAWVTVDDLDNDPTTLISYVAAALARIGPIDRSIAAGLAGPGKRVLTTAVPRLASALHRWDTPAVLVIDDVHRLVDPAPLDALAALLDHLPAGITVALAGRLAPNLPFARLRAQRHLLEIVSAQLALDEHETGALARATGWMLDQQGVRELTARTEGWAAAVYLASLRAASDPIEAGVSTVSGADRYIAEYLLTEVQGRLADEDVLVLTRTSILESVTPALAETVAGVPNASHRLAQLAERNLMIRELPGLAPSYRYHLLLQEFLRRELEQREAGLVPDLHRRAAASYMEAQIPERAVEHLILGGDRDHAAQLLATVSLRLFYRGGAVTLERLLSRFDRVAFERTPSLAVIAAWVYLLSGRAEESLAMADIAERTADDGPAATGAASFESERAMLRAIMGAHGPADIYANARLAADQELPTSPWRANALWLLGSAHRLIGEFEAADEQFAQAIDAGAMAGATAMVSLAGRAALAIRRGEWAAAEAFVRQADEQRREAHYEGFVASLIVHALAARVAMHRGLSAEAQHHLVQAQLVRPLATHVAPWFSVDALLELARAYLAGSDAAGARQALRDAEQIIRRRPALGTVTDELVAMRQRLEGAASVLAGSSSLTTAELRVLPLLPTYLSFQEIADRLMVSRNTVKTHAMSIYGKLWASSRGEAVERAIELGLLEPYPVLQDHGRDAVPTRGDADI